MVHQNVLRQGPELIRRRSPRIEVIHLEAGTGHQATADRLFHQVVIGSSLAATTSLSVGYVIWTLRGGFMVASMISALPAWAWVDPHYYSYFLRGRP